MQKIFDIQHDGKKTYRIDGKPLICDESLNQRKDKSHALQLVVSNDALPKSTQFTVRKSADGWLWVDPNRRFPMVIHAEGSAALNELFPAAQPGESYSVWVTHKITKHKKD